MNIRLGVIGTGRIAERFVVDAGFVKQFVISAVYNPHRCSAEQFAKKHGVPYWTDLWEEFSANIDAAYIASPHETHVNYAKLLLKQGIHILCEKPMALCKKDVKEMFALARIRKCILMEAIKTAYCPGFRSLIKTAQSGKIGRICDVEVCFTKLEKEEHRELVDLKYGGSVTELGSYVFLPIVILLGTEYKKLSFSSINAYNGLDLYTKGILDYGDAMALGKVGLGVKSEGQLVIAGTKGYILAESPWWLTKKFEVRYEDPTVREIYTYPFEASGLQYELAAFADAIKNKIYNGSSVMNNEIQEYEVITEDQSVAIAGIIEKYICKRL